MGLFQIGDTVKSINDPGLFGLVFSIDLAAKFRRILRTKEGQLAGIVEYDRG